MNNNSKTVAALIAGLAAGAALGILFAPGKGGETQDRLSRALNDLKDRVIDGALHGIEKVNAIGDEVKEKVKDRLAKATDEVKEQVSEKNAEA